MAQFKNKQLLLQQGREPQQGEVSLQCMADLLILFGFSCFA